MISEKDLRSIADKADFIVRGYAFTKDDKGIIVINLYQPSRVMIISVDGKMLETNMDSIEQNIVLNIWEDNSEFMEKSYA